MSNSKRFLAGIAIGAGVLGGAVALSAPALAATCTQSASLNGFVASAKRSGCTGSTGTIEIRFMKNVVLAPDLPAVTKYQKGFQNGSISVTGNCGAGKGTYYGWGLFKGSTIAESPRRDLCY